MGSRSELEEGVAGLVQSPFADGRSSEYAQRIATLLNRHYKHGRVKMLGDGDNASADATPGLDETCVRRSYCKGS